MIEDIRNRMANLRRTETSSREAKKKNFLSGVLIRP